MWKISMRKKNEIDGGSNPVRFVNTPKADLQHNALFKVIAVLFPRELILSLIFGRIGFRTPVWRATVKENVDVIHLKEIC